MSNNTYTELPQLLDLIDAEYKTGEYINLFIVNDIVSYAGYATMPGGSNQAIVIQRKVFGDYNYCTTCDLHSFSNGKTIAHEFGHYLGLWHTDHGGCAGMDENTCDVEGDGCCDTPPVAKYNTLCLSGVNSCNENPDYPDQIENFMDYTPESCALWFTRNQNDNPLRELLSKNMFSLF